MFNVIKFYITCFSSIILLFCTVCCATGYGEIKVFIYIIKCLDEASLRLHILFRFRTLILKIFNHQEKPVATTQKGKKEKERNKLN